jgi:transcriptional regulator GlxA family with amidase domain
MSKNRTMQPDQLAATEPKISSPLQVTFLIVPRFNMSTLVTMIEPMRISPLAMLAPD